MYELTDAECALTAWSDALGQYRLAGKVLSSITADGKVSVSIRFLGTGGARFVVAKQIRASGGMWMRFGATQIHVDPGPGALVRALSTTPPQRPAELDAIVLSHKHLDHAGDVNAMIEAMAQGGWKPRGALFAPRDAWEGDSILLPYARRFVPRHEVVDEHGGPYAINDVEVRASIRHVHPVETYGLHFRYAGKTLSYLPCTRFFDGDRRPSRARAGVLVINVTTPTRWTSITLRSRTPRRDRGIRPGRDHDALRYEDARADPRRIAYQLKTNWAFASTRRTTADPIRKPIAVAARRHEFWRRRPCVAQRGLGFKVVGHEQTHDITATAGGAIAWRSNCGSPPARARRSVMPCRQRPGSGALAGALRRAGEHNCWQRAAAFNHSPAQRSSPAAITSRGAFRSIRSSSTSRCCANFAAALASIRRLGGVPDACAPRASTNRWMPWRDRNARRGVRSRVRAASVRIRAARRRSTPTFTPRSTNTSRLCGRQPAPRFRLGTAAAGRSRRDVAGMNANVAAAITRRSTSSGVLRWWGEVFGFPSTAGGILTTGTLMANLVRVLSRGVPCDPGARRCAAGLARRPYVD